MDASEESRRRKKRKSSQERSLHHKRRRNPTGSKADEESSVKRHTEHHHRRHHRRSHSKSRRQESRGDGSRESLHAAKHKHSHHRRRRHHRRHGTHGEDGSDKHGHKRRHSSSSSAAEDSAGNTVPATQTQGAATSNIVTSIGSPPQPLATATATTPSLTGLADFGIDNDSRRRTLIHYIQNRGKMLSEAFSALSATSVDRLLPKPLQGFALTKVKELCLQQVGVLSDSQLRAVIEEGRLFSEAELGLVMIKEKSPERPLSLSSSSENVSAMPAKRAGVVTPPEVCVPSVSSPPPVASRGVEECEDGSLVEIMVSENLFDDPPSSPSPAATAPADSTSQAVNTDQMTLKQLQQRRKELEDELAVRSKRRPPPPPKSLPSKSPASILKPSLPKPSPPKPPAPQPSPSSAPPTAPAPGHRLQRQPSPAKTPATPAPGLTAQHPDKDVVVILSSPDSSPRTLSQAVGSPRIRKVSLAGPSMVVQARPSSAAESQPSPLASIASEEPAANPAVVTLSEDDNAAGQRTLDMEKEEQRLRLRALKSMNKRLLQQGGKSLP